MFYQIDYYGYSLVYYFSSERRLKKFKNLIDENRKVVNERLYKRYGFNIKLDVLSDIELYNSCEPRFFCIEKVGGEVALCLNQIELNGDGLIIQNYQALSKDLIAK